ncbi:MAG: hypothetical protein GF334_09020 [Candidatus Altiarchaeales archaeon]|nr:hypothetical protein [Candidatus Altiarchaeales archaeon]
MMAVEIKLEEELPEKPIIIEAFPSKGYVSTIASYYLIKENNWKQIGCINVDELDGFVVVHESKVMHPMRIYRKDNLILLFSEIIIPHPLIPQFRGAVMKWFKEIKPSKVVLLASMLGKETTKEHEILALTTEEDVKKKLKKHNIETLTEGVLTGVSSTIALNCYDNQIPYLALMVETQYVPDALAAASLLHLLDDLFDLGVDVSKLEETGKQLEKKFTNLLDQLKNTQEKYHGTQNQTPMYR